MTHCWEGRGDWFEEQFGWDDPRTLKAKYEEPSATCMLEHGHEGDHEWTPDEEITISFTEAPK